MYFTFSVRLNDGEWDGVEVAFPNRQDAIDGARYFLEARVDRRPLLVGEVRFATIGVAVGRMSREEVAWLGEWEFTAETDSWWWTPSAKAH